MSQRRPDEPPPKGLLVGAILFVVGLWLVVPWIWLKANQFVFGPLRIEHAGSLADYFGSVTALFTGLAFAGILIQLYFQNRQIQENREEMRTQRSERLLAVYLELLDEYYRLRGLYWKARNEIHQPNPTEFATELTKRKDFVDAFANHYGCLVRLQLLLSLMPRDFLEDLSFPQRLDEDVSWWHKHYDVFVQKGIVHHQERLRFFSEIVRPGPASRDDSPAAARELPNR